MTRMKISLCILSLLTAASIITGIWTERKCREIAERADSAVTFEDVRELDAEWQRFRKIAGMMIVNSRLTEIDRLCARAVRAAEVGNDELSADLAEIERMAEMLCE